ncbi:MAG: CBS and ACT domain-containing protein [Desulfobacterales bacterium]|jgi:acetoin utilization protein AcuB
MLVKNWMSKPVITIEAESSMQEAGRLLEKHHVRMLPVMNRDKLVGILTDRDLKRASASDATSLEKHELLYLLSEIEVRDIMTKNPICVTPDYTIEEIARILMEHKISGVPVVKTHGGIVGIVTQTDLCRVLINLTGVDRRGIQFSLQVLDRPKSIIEIKDIIHGNGGRIVSLLTSYENVPPGYRNIYLRVYQIDRSILPKLQAELKERALLLYMRDKQFEEQPKPPADAQCTLSQMSLN